MPRNEFPPDSRWDPNNEKIATSWAKDVRVTGSLTPPMQDLASLCGSFLKAGWKYRDTFVDPHAISPFSPPMDEVSPFLRTVRLLYVYENPSLARRGVGVSPIQDIEPYFKQASLPLETKGARMADQILAETPYRCEELTARLNTVGLGPDNVYQRGVLVFRLELLDSRERLPEFSQRVLMHANELQDLVANLVELSRRSSKTDSLLPPDLIPDTLPQGAGEERGSAVNATGLHFALVQVMREYSPARLGTLARVLGASEYRTTKLLKDLEADEVVERTGNRYTIRKQEEPTADENLTPQDVNLKLS